jgi:hypothetical protein
LDREKFCFKLFDVSCSRATSSTETTSIFASYFLQTSSCTNQYRPVAVLNLLCHVLASFLGSFLIYLPSTSS